MQSHAVQSLVEFSLILFRKDRSLRSTSAELVNAWSTAWSRESRCIESRVDGGWRFNAMTSSGRPAFVYPTAREFQHERERMQTCECKRANANAMQLRSEDQFSERSRHT